jgi:hypothetical protein
MGGWGRQQPRRSGRGRPRAEPESPGQITEEIRVRAAGGKGQPDAAGGFLHPHGDLEQAQPQRGELGFGEIAPSRNGLPHRQHQPVRGRVQHQDVGA